MPFPISFLIYLLRIRKDRRLHRSRRSRKKIAAEFSNFLRSVHSFLFSEIHNWWHILKDLEQTVDQMGYVYRAPLHLFAFSYLHKKKKKENCQVSCRLHLVDYGLTRVSWNVAMKSARHLHPRTIAAYVWRSIQRRRELHRSAINYGRTRQRRQPDRQ